MLQITMYIFIYGVLCRSQSQRERDSNLGPLGAKPYTIHICIYIYVYCIYYIQYIYYIILYTLALSLYIYVQCLFYLNIYICRYATVYFCILQKQYAYDIHYICCRYYIIYIWYVYDVLYTLFHKVYTIIYIYTIIIYHVLLLGASTIRVTC